MLRYFVRLSPKQLPVSSFDFYKRRLWKGVNCEDAEVLSSVIDNEPAYQSIKQKQKSGCRQWRPVQVLSNTSSLSNIPTKISILACYMQYTLFWRCSVCVFQSEFGDSRRQLVDSEADGAPKTFSGKNSSSPTFAPAAEG